MAPLGLLARRLMATVKHVACLQVQSVSAYIRCNGGDYFRSEYCPLDGWTSDYVREFLTALKKLEQG
jgi:hypothetical protein